MGELAVALAKRLDINGVEAYHVVIANLDPTPERQAPPEDAGASLEYFDSA